jgi:hypothetical protein
LAQREEIALGRARGDSIRTIAAVIGRSPSPEQIAGRLKVDFPNRPEMRVCLCYPCNGARRRVTLRTHLDGTPCPLPRRGQVTGQHPLVSANHRQPCVRRRRTQAFKKPLRSRQPAADWCHQGSVENQVHRDPNTRTRGRDQVTALQVSGVGALPRLDCHSKMAGRVRDLAQQS